MAQRHLKIHPTFLERPLSDVDSIHHRVPVRGRESELNDAITCVVRFLTHLHLIYTMSG